LAVAEISPGGLREAWTGPAKMHPVAGLRNDDAGVMFSNPNLNNPARDRVQ